MERYLQIGKENLKFHLPAHLLVTAFILCLSPLVMGVSNLKAEDTAKVLEMYVALSGVVMLVPVFLPEQDKSIRELVYSKYTSPRAVYYIRITENILILSVFLALYLGMLKNNGCEMDFVRCYLGTWSEILFLGGLGIFFYGVFDHLIIGYMAPLFYYVIAVGSGDKYLKMLYPFSMSRGSYTEKWWLLGAALLLIVLGVKRRGGTGYF